MPPETPETEDPPPELLVGPVTVSDDHPFVAWVAQTADAPMVCFVAHLDEDSLLADNLPTLLRFTYEYAEAKLQNWRDVPVLIGTMKEGGKGLNIHTYAGTQRDAEPVARDVLRSLAEVHETEVDGRIYRVSRFAPDPESGMIRVDVSSSEHPDVTRSCLMRSFDELQLEILIRSVATAEEEYDANMYVSEARASLQRGNPMEAFRSFNYAVMFGDAVDPDPIIGFGTELANALNVAQMWDHAEYVSSLVERIARTAARPVDAAHAARYRGIACSFIGSVEETIGHLTRAVGRVEDITDHRAKVLVHMSFGLTVVDLLAHWECERNRLPDTSGLFLQTQLGIAARHLDIACDLIGDADDERSIRNRAAIELDRIRVRDLRGDHEGAIAALDELTNADGFPATDKLVATAELYRLAALKKLADQDEAHLERFISEVFEAIRRVNSLDEKRGIRDRLCVLCVLASIPFLRVGRHTAGTGQLDGFQTELENTAQNLEDGYEIQKAMRGFNVRPPMPDTRYGGIGNIDIAGRLQMARILLAGAQDDPSPIWDAWRTADEAKGRFFRRDLGWSAIQRVEGVPPGVRRRAASLRRASMGAGVDQRVLLAEWEWSLARDVDAEVAEAVRENSSFERAIEPGDLGELLGTDGSTALVSLYATGEETIIYVARSPDEAPAVSVWAMPPRQIMGVIDDFETGLFGDRKHGPIDPDEPSARDRFFEDFVGFEPGIEKLAELLSGCRHIVISPHGVWHRLPIFQMLLPVFWEKGEEVGIRYVPSLRTLQILRRRREAAALTSFGGAAVVTVPARGDDEELFAKAHGIFVELMESGGLRAESAFGGDATVERVQEYLRRSGVAHLLAHGRTETDRHVMRSGLLLADDDGLPDRDADAPGGLLTGSEIMAGSAVADHVTVQACSMGRTQAARGDELWGFSRALLAAGANRVIAPLWDIDLESSTNLLCRFYDGWLRGGAEPDIAFAAAQKELFDGVGEKAWRHFYHWAPFQMIGW
jgi:hypothetical protein